LCRLHWEWHPGRGCRCSLASLFSSDGREIFRLHGQLTRGFVAVSVDPNSPSPAFLVELANYHSEAAVQLGLGFEAFNSHTASLTQPNVGFAPL
jgi:hypothetical protein